MFAKNLFHGLKDYFKEKYEAFDSVARPIYVYFLEKGAQLFVKMEGSVLLFRVVF